VLRLIEPKDQGKRDELSRAFERTVWRIKPGDVTRRSSVTFDSYRWEEANDPVTLDHDDAHVSSSSNGMRSRDHDDDSEMVADAVHQIIARNSCTRDRAEALSARLSGAITPRQVDMKEWFKVEEMWAREIGGGGGTQISSRPSAEMQQSVNRHTVSPPPKSDDQELIALARRLMTEPVGPWKGEYYRAPENDDLLASKGVSFSDLQAKLGDMINTVNHMKGGVQDKVSRHLPAVVHPPKVWGLKFVAANLTAMDTNLFYGRTSDPYLLLFQEKQLVGKTSVVPHSLNPVWDKIQVKLDPALKVLIHCFDENKHIFMIYIYIYIM